MECHTPTHSPGFDEILEYVRLEVDHSRTDPSLKDILEQRMRGPMKPQVELFVMSFCPFGVQAEEELLPFIAKYGEAVDFNLRFIANLVEETAADKKKYTSLHGEPEVIENLRQIAISQLYPDRFFDYLLCRAKHLESAWTLCADDLVLAMEVLEHIPDPLEGLQEAVRVLKPGGYAITSIPVQLPIPMHLYVPKSPREVLNLYERSGLDVLDFSAKEFKIETGSFVATFAFSVKG